MIYLVEEEAYGGAVDYGVGVVKVVDISGIGANEFGAGLFDAFIEFAHAGAEGVAHGFVAAAEQGHFLAAEVNHVEAIEEVEPVGLRFAVAPGAGAAND